MLSTHAGKLERWLGAAQVEARDGDTVLDTGTGTSKKAAEQAAAAEALEENGS